MQCDDVEEHPLAKEGRYWSSRHSLDGTNSKNEISNNRERLGSWDYNNPKILKEIDNSGSNCRIIAWQNCIYDLIIDILYWTIYVIWNSLDNHGHALWLIWNDLKLQPLNASRFVRSDTNIQPPIWSLYVQNDFKLLANISSIYFRNNIKLLSSISPICVRNDIELLSLILYNWGMEWHWNSHHGGRPDPLRGDI